jgi:hypothetical protein
MEVDDSDDVLLVRSKMWDNKIEEKRKKLEEEARMMMKMKLEKEKMEQEKKKRIEKNEERLKRMKLRIKKKSQKKSGIKDNLLKPYLRELPNIIKDLIGDGYFLYPIKGDGSCGLRTPAAWIFQDQTLGPYLAREINRIFVKNWDFWQDYFIFPFVRNVGNGKEIKKENKEELFEFLMNSKDGAFMWRGEEDFSLLCSMYKFNIKIITVDGSNKPTITMIEPNPELSRFSDFPEGQIPDMVVLHQKNIH